MGIYWLDHPLTSSWEPRTWRSWSTMIATPRWRVERAFIRRAHRPPERFGRLGRLPLRSVTQAQTTLAYRPCGAGTGSGRLCTGYEHNGSRDSPDIGGIHSFFYRIVDVTDTGTALILDLETPLVAAINGPGVASPSLPGVIIVMENVATVFERRTGWQP